MSPSAWQLKLLVVAVVAHACLVLMCPAVKLQGNVTIESAPGQRYQLAFSFVVREAQLGHGVVLHYVTWCDVMWHAVG